MVIFIKNIAIGASKFQIRHKKILTALFFIIRSRKIPNSSKNNANEYSAIAIIVTTERI
jgi:hypothetical protein